MSDRTVLALLRDDQLTLYAMNGTGEAHELAKLRVSDRTPNAIASLVQGLVPFLAKQAPVEQPRMTGILGTPRPAGAPVAKAPAKRAAKRAPSERMPVEGRAAQFRAIVTATPGIARQEVLRRMGLTNPSGTQWSRMVEVAGVRKTKEGAGRTAATRYWPAEVQAP